MVLVSLLFMAPVTAIAQSSRDAPPYETQVMRVSEILGALHFLRPLCGADDIPDWRTQMEDFLDAETIDGPRRRRFVERFNQGYRGFASVYQSCSPSARIAMEQYILEGQELIRNVASRYGR